MSRSIVIRFGFLLALLASLTGCEFDKTLTLNNGTGETLTPYPVVSDPPPPHREADPQGAVAPGGTAPIDPVGFNPVFYAEDLTEDQQPNGIFLALALNDSPRMIQYKVLHYRVPPGTEGNDPAKQPILLKEGFEEVTNKDIEVGVFKISTPSEFGWNVVISEK